MALHKNGEEAFHLPRDAWDQFPPHRRGLYLWTLKGLVECMAHGQQNCTFFSGVQLEECTSNEISHVVTSALKQ